ncbi:MAG TPA: hypothetical protein VE871_10875 [Longimicrobium sp.]|nr:hypothetical protein [Longimicrobium sp.]
MKNNKYFLATVVALSLGACSSDLTEPQLRAPDGPPALVAADTTPPPPAPSPGEDPGGIIGSGMGK